MLYTSSTVLYGIWYVEKLLRCRSVRKLGDKIVPATFVIKNNASWYSRLTLSLERLHLEELKSVHEEMVPDFGGRKFPYHII